MSNCRSIVYTKSDDTFVHTLNTNDFYSEIRIFANKKYSKKQNFLENISETELMQINEKLRDNLENRTFISDKCAKYIENIVNEVNDILLKRSNRPCSYHVGFINALPLKGLYFTYKFVRLEYMPFFFAYSNDSLLNRLYLFIVNN